MVAEVNFNKNNTILTGDGLLDAVGEQIQYTFIIQNEGDDFLDELHLTDSLLGFNNLDVISAISAGQLSVAGDTDGDLLLDPGEEWVITEGLVAGVDLTYTVTQEDFDSNGTAEDTGTDPDIAGRIDNYADLLGLKDEQIQTVSQESSAAVLTLLPEIDIEKATNGEDADSPTGPNIAVGDTVTWTYVVTNTGNVALSNVVVTDDNGTAGTGDDFNPTFVGGDTDGDGELDVDETWTYQAQAVATAGQYANIADVTGDDPAGTTVDDLDPSHYFGVLSGIDIEKATNGDDADSPTGPNILVGGAVTWTYVVTNTGNVALANVVVTDDNGTAGTGDDFNPTFVGGDTDGDGELDVDETWTYQALGVATAGQYANVAEATGVDTLGETVDDDDPSHYFGVDPDIDIVKSGAFNDENGDGFAQPGETITYDYSVTTGTGNVAIENVVVTDDNGTPGDPLDDFLPTFVGGDDGDGVLEIGETWIYTVDVAIDQDDINAGGITNIACANGDDVLLGTPVEDCDPETVTLIPPPPPSDPGGNTRGFWGRWDDAFAESLDNVGLDPDDLYEDVFNVTLTGNLAGITLDEALGVNGGGIRQLIPQSVAALANAAMEEADYSFAGFEGVLASRGVLDTLEFIDTNDDQDISVDEIIAAVGDVIPDGNAGGFDVEDVKDAFDVLNNTLPSVDASEFDSFGV